MWPVINEIRLQKDKKGEDAKLKNFFLKTTTLKVIKAKNKN